MLDVTLVAEGKQIRAHKLVLAGSSSYFSTQFNGNWCNNDTIVLDDIPYPVLSIIVDFAYTDNFGWTDMQVHKDEDYRNFNADRLDILLDLLTGADRFGMPALTAQVETILEDRKFIRPDTVLGVLARA